MDMMAYETALNTGWILLGAALVFFMQAGFAMVETGFTRAKNACNIIMKNRMDFSLGVPIFWLIGYGIMFAGEGKLIGGLDLFTNAGGDWATMIFQTVFCATAATIVFGAMAERTKFSAYCVYSMVISAFVYPISGHWIWGGAGSRSWDFVISPALRQCIWSTVSRLSLALRSWVLVSASMIGKGSRVQFLVIR